MWPPGQRAPLRQLPRQPLALPRRQLEAAPASSAGSWRPGSRRRGGPVRGGPARHTAPPAPALAGGPHTRGPAPPTGPATEREGHAESGQTNCRAHDTCAAQPTLGASRETAVSGHLPSESGSWAVGVRGTAGAGVSRRGLRKVSEQFVGGFRASLARAHLRGPVPWDTPSRCRPQWGACSTRPSPAQASCGQRLVLLPHPPFGEAPSPPARTRRSRHMSWCHWCSRWCWTSRLGVGRGRGEDRRSFSIACDSPRAPGRVQAGRRRAPDVTCEAGPLLDMVSGRAKAPPLALAAPPPALRLASSNAVGRQAWRRCMPRAWCGRAMPPQEWRLREAGDATQRALSPASRPGTPCARGLLLLRLPRPQWTWRRGTRRSVRRGWTRWR